MRLRFFSVPVGEPGPAEPKLNAFLATRRVVAVARELIHDGPRSAWAFCVTVAGGSPERAEDAPTPEQPRMDCKAVLPPDQLEIFVRLRTLRLTISEREGVPRYGVFNNEQLAEMVRRPVRTRARLAAIPGVGPARVTRDGSWGWAGWPAVDPALVAAAGPPRGEDPRAVGVSVGATESPSDVRRPPTPLGRGR